MQCITGNSIGTLFQRVTDFMNLWAKNKVSELTCLILAGKCDESSGVRSLLGCFYSI